MSICIIGSIIIVAAYFMWAFSLIHDETDTDPDKERLADVEEYL